jgi:uncharacterized protein
MFSDAVKKVQEARGSRAIYARVEKNGGFEREVTDDLRDFLATIDTAFLATASKDGDPYVQHRGGPKGFLRVIDEHTIGFADFAGNRQYITTGNLTENDRVCLFLMDYEKRRRIKVWGTAKVVPLTEELAKVIDPQGYRGRREQAIVIHVTGWDVNCPQHIPQKLDAKEVALVIADLRARIRALEEENVRLRSSP